MPCDMSYAGSRKDKVFLARRHRRGGPRVATKYYNAICIDIAHCGRAVALSRFHSECRRAGGAGKGRTAVEASKQGQRMDSKTMARRMQSIILYF